jgi:hypothetical protein
MNMKIKELIGFFNYNIFAKISNKSKGSGEENWSHLLRVFKIPEMR